MKNNKGFTIVELTVVIGLLAVLAIIIGANMVGLQGKQKEKEYNAYKEKLESAACLYMNKSENTGKKSRCRINNNSSDCLVSVDALINASLIDYDLKNPSTDKIAREEENQIKVKWVDGEQICEYQE